MVLLFGLTILSTVGSLGHCIAQQVPTGFMDYPSSFSFPPSCSNTKQVGNVSYCSTGILDPLGKWIVFDLYMFDLFHPEETVLFGVIVTLHNGKPEGLIPRAGGCAAPVYVQLKPPQKRAATRICSSTNLISTPFFGNTTYFNGNSTHIADNFKSSVSFAVLNETATLHASVWTAEDNYSSSLVGYPVGFRLSVYSEMKPLDNSTLNWHVFNALDIGIPNYPMENMFNVDVNVHIPPHPR